MFKRPSSELKFEMEDQTVTAVLEMAARPGAWARQEYKEQANALTGEVTSENWDDLPATTQQRWILHQWAGAAIAGATQSLTVKTGKGKAESLTVTPELIEALPDQVLGEMTVQAYRYNPHWAPPSIREAMAQETGADPNATTGTA